MPVYDNLPEFCANFTASEGVLMGIDPGKKRIGVAFSDRQQQMAFSSFIASSVADIMAQTADRMPVAIVVGYPRRTDGTLGSSAQKARKIAESLMVLWQDKSPTDVQMYVLLWEEWYSSQAMEKMLIAEVDMSRQKRKKNLDKLAAAFILQGALDAMQNFRAQI